MRTGIVRSFRWPTRDSHVTRRDPMRNRPVHQPAQPGRAAVTVFAMVLLLFAAPPGGSSQARPFDVMEATIADIHAAYKARRLTSHQLVQLYLDRIAAYDK